jgi:guanyl-specific ribonuclease Sa
MPADDQHEHHDEFTTPHHDINVSEVKAPESEETTHVNVAAEPHSIYTPREKWFIVALIAFGGLFRYPSNDHEFILI